MSSIVEYSKNAHGNSREYFDCGQHDVNTYLRRTASQHQKKLKAKFYVDFDSEESSIRGYYSLIDYNSEKIANDNFETDKSFLLMKLGVDIDYQDQGVAKNLIRHAILSCPENSLILVNPKDEVSGLYEKIGFEWLDNDLMYVTR